MADSRKIGVFDSGLGGLTIARILADKLPHESLLYFGDTERCPYGERPQEDVQRFAEQIASWLIARDIKLLVIACNTATAAAFPALQKSLHIPVIGVIKPGARSGVTKTKTKRIGVLATKGTVTSEAYPRVIHAIEKDIEVFQATSSDSVELVEHFLYEDLVEGKKWLSPKSVEGDKVLLEKAFAIATKDIQPLKDKDIDTVILGCTHFPLLKPAFQKAFGSNVVIVSSAEETEKEVARVLAKKNIEASQTQEPSYSFATTADDIESFKQAGSFIFGRPLTSIENVPVATLEN